MRDNYKEKLQSLNIGILGGLISGIVIFTYNFLLEKGHGIGFSIIFAVIAFIVIYGMAKNSLRRNIKK